MATVGASGSGANGSGAAIASGGGGSIGSGGVGTQLTSRAGVTCPAGPSTVMGGHSVEISGFVA